MRTVANPPRFLSRSQSLFFLGGPPFCLRHPSALGGSLPPHTVLHPGVGPCVLTLAKELLVHRSLQSRAPQKAPALLMKRGTLRHTRLLLISLPLLSSWTAAAHTVLPEAQTKTIRTSLQQICF